MFRHPRVGQAELGVALPVFHAYGLAIKTRNLQQHAVEHAVAGSLYAGYQGDAWIYQQALAQRLLPL